MNLVTYLPTHNDDTFTSKICLLYCICRFTDSSKESLIQREKADVFWWFLNSLSLMEKIIVIIYDVDKWIRVFYFALYSDTCIFYIFLYCLDIEIQEYDLLDKLISMNIS